MPVIFVLAGALLFAGGGDAPSNQVSQVEMRQLYQENQQLKDKSARLDAELKSIEAEIEVTKKAIDNLKYVEAENAKYTESIGK